MSSLGESIDRKAALEAQPREIAPRSRFRVALKDVVFWVFGVAVFLDLTRRRLEWERIPELRNRFQHLSLLRLGHVYHRRDPGTAAGDANDRARPGQAGDRARERSGRASRRSAGDPLAGIVLALLLGYVAEQTGSVAAHERALRGLWHEMTQRRLGFGALAPAPPDFSFRDEVRAPRWFRCAGCS